MILLFVVFGVGFICGALFIGVVEVKNERKTYWRGKQDAILEMRQAGQPKEYRTRQLRALHEQYQR